MSLAGLTQQALCMEMSSGHAPHSSWPADTRSDRPATDRDGVRWSLQPAGVWRTRLRGIARPLGPPRLTGVRLRLTVFRRSVQLDRALAEGRSPACCRQLELRAQQLASARVRWSLADAFRGVVAKAERSSTAPALIPLLLLPLAAPVPAPSTPIAARDALLDLADALTDPGCTSVQGIAQASWLLCDADSPLYARLPARTLQRIARGAIVALHGET
jgi:hypothetical protein